MNISDIRIKLRTHHQNKFCPGYKIVDQNPPKLDDIDNSSTYGYVMERFEADLVTAYTKEDHIPFETFYGDRDYKSKNIFKPPPKCPEKITTIPPACEISKMLSKGEQQYLHIPGHVGKYPVTCFIPNLLDPEAKFHICPGYGDDEFCALDECDRFMIYFGITFLLNAF